MTWPRTGERGRLGEGLTLLASPVPDLGTAPAVFEIGLILLLAVGAGWLFRRFGLPAILGYLLVGVAVSPFTPGYVANRGELELLADVGVVLLLFEVGIEIDPLRLGRSGLGLLWMAPLQVVITTIAAGAGLLAFGLTPPAAVLIGLSLAMSSSVVVINITRSKRRTTNRPTEEALLAWSVLQDLASVGLALVLLSSLGLGTLPPFPAIASVVAFIVLAVAAAWLLPRLLHGLRSEHDLFLLLSVGQASGWPASGHGSSECRSPSRPSSPAWPSVRARPRPRRAAGSCLFAISSRCSSSSSWAA